MPSSRFLSLDDAAQWERIVATWPGGLDVYFRADYHAAFRYVDPGQPFLFVYESGGEQLLYPFVLRPITRIGAEAAPPGLRDIEGVYGFSGPVATSADSAFLTAAWAAFETFCVERGVVAEFVRFHPLLANQRFRAAAVETIKVREHVVLDLAGDDRSIWAAYSKQNRNTIRKAERLGVSCRVGPVSGVVDEFVRLYGVTMDRNRASPGYYFSEEHFVALANVPSLACAAFREGRLLAISLFLLGPERIHYHLSGCGEEGLKSGANNLILHHMVLEARRLRLGVFHFGGGRTSAPEDPLLRFKAGFSSGRADVFVGRRVHDRPSYEALCERRRAQTPVPPGYFLAYRYEPPAAEASR